MITFDETLDMLDELAEGFPAEFYTNLNAGIVLLDETKRDTDGDTYILGEYCYEPYGMGRYIRIYFGSFRRLYGRWSKARQKAELKRILKHEFTHHIEHLAGDRSLEIKDAMERERRRSSDNNEHQNQNHDCH